MTERLIPRARPDDDILGSDKRPVSEGTEGREAVKYIQPKAQDALEVERLGLMKVPRRFSYAEAKEAIAAGIQVIARSEHPDEAKGESGVNPSWTFDKKEPLRGKTESDFELSMFLSDFHMKYNRNFCEINGIDPSVHNESLSWSFWEKIPGTNLTVVEDNVVPGRYLIFGRWTYDIEGPSGKMRKMYGTRVFMVEADKINAQESIHPIPPELETAISEIVSDYEKVKNHFGAKTAWSMEMQLTNSGQLYFLQRHPTRAYESCDWAYDTSPDSDEIVIKSTPDTIVRGTTPKEGFEVDMIYDGYGYLPKIPQQQAYTPRNAQNPVMFQKWLAQSKMFLETQRTDVGQAADPHSAIIPLTKPNLYICVPGFEKKLPREWEKKYAEVRGVKGQRRKEFGETLRKERDDKAIDEKEYYARASAFSNNPENLTRIKMRVRSDGTEARIKILDIH